MDSDDSKNKSSKRKSAKLTDLLDEDEWVIQVRTSIEEEIEEEDVEAHVSIFSVPQAMVSFKPEAYVPQLFAFGPYHHWRPQLYDMEKYKLAAARRMQARLGGTKFEEIAVGQFLKRDYRIRCHYHKYLDIGPEVLAWMMAIDACFVLEFLQNNYAEQQSASQQPQAKAPAAATDTPMRKIGHNMICRDVAMLENQIPLFLLQELLTITHQSEQRAEEELSNILTEFINELSPFNTTTYPNFSQHQHLLEVLYHSIVPTTTEDPPLGEIKEEVATVEAKDTKEAADPGMACRATSWVWGQIYNTGAIKRAIKRVILSRPVMLVVKLPWKAITSVPVFRIIKLPVEGFFKQMLAKNKPENPADGAEKKPPLAEEISIPSVSELSRVGVRFVPADGDITTIRFDPRTVTMYLPAIGLDVNTEVVMRNLVAYEAYAMPGRLVFTRYAELMCGIIDTEEDVKILRGEGVVVNRLKSDGEAAGMWNGMSKSVRLSKVGFLDRAIAEVNRYYGRRWRVKMRGFMRKYVFGSWQVLTFLAAGLLLFLTCVQAFCSVYTCNTLLTKATSLGGGHS